MAGRKGYGSSNVRCTVKRLEEAGRTVLSRGGWPVCMIYCSSGENVLFEIGWT